MAMENGALGDADEIWAFWVSWTRQIDDGRYDKKTL